jgi:hypothetical protein
MEVEQQIGGELAIGCGIRFQLGALTWVNE